MSVGEMRSPSKWIAKMESAMALARNATGTPCRMTTLMGDVDMKIANSAAAMPTKNPTGEPAKKQAAANGTLTSVVVVAPCPKCGLTKAKALIPLLRRKGLKVCSHIVLDRKTADELLGLP